MIDDNITQCFGVMVVALVVVICIAFVLWLIHCDLKYYIKRTHELSTRLEKVTDLETMEKKEQEFIKRGWINVNHDDG
jgi:hypothetical protein